MVWLTYTPDGRTLEVEYSNGSWLASCDSGRGVGETASEAITRSLGEGATSIGTSSGTMDDWVAQQAAQLELERVAGESGPERYA